MSGPRAAVMALGLFVGASPHLSARGRQPSSDEAAIRAARAAFNDAIARHDLDAIRTFLADDYRAAVSNGTFRTSPQAMVDAFAERFDAFPDATYERVPGSIRVSASAPAAWEDGDWVGRWTTADGPFRTGGRYSADWRRDDDGWRLHAELFVPLWCEGPGCSDAPVSGGDPVAELLALHELVLAAHRAGDVEAWMAVEGDPYVSANGGMITFPTAAERRSMREPYLETTSFEIYRDVREPVVEISSDGTLGWVIAQVEVRGTQRGADSVPTPVASVWAWIELYRRVEGQWKLVGNVSNRQGGS